MKALTFVVFAMAGCSTRQPMDVTTGDPPEITRVGQNPDATYVVDGYTREPGGQARLTFLVHPRRSKPVGAVTEVVCLDGEPRSPDVTIHQDPAAAAVTLEFDLLDCAPAEITTVIHTSKRVAPIRMRIPRAVLYRAQRWPEVRP